MSHDRPPPPPRETDNLDNDRARGATAEAPRRQRTPGTSRGLVTPVMRRYGAMVQRKAVQRSTMDDLIDGPKEDSIREDRATINPDEPAAASGPLLPRQASHAARRNAHWSRRLGFTAADFSISAATSSPDFAQQIARFQQQRNLTADGIAGPKTFRAMGNSATLEPGVIGGPDDRTTLEPGVIGGPDDRTTLEPGVVQMSPGDGGAAHSDDSVRDIAAAGVAGTGGPLPHLAQIQKSFGPEHTATLTQVRAHRGQEAKSAANSIGAEAYATGNDIAFAGTPSLHTAAHEAAHVLQQQRGVALKGGVGQAGDIYEQEADKAANAVVAGTQATLGLAVGKRTALSRSALQLRDRASHEGKARPISWEEAMPTMQAIAGIINNQLLLFAKVKRNKLYWADITSDVPDIPAKWKPLLREWLQIRQGWIHDEQTGVVTGYTGDILTAHIDSAAAATAPLVSALIRNGDKTTRSWIAANYSAQVRQLRARATTESIREAIDSATSKSQDSARTSSSLSSPDGIRASSSSGLTAARAVATVASRFSSANRNQVDQLESRFSRSVAEQRLPNSIVSVQGKHLGLAIAHIQAGLNLVKTLTNIEDPNERYRQYQRQWKQFGPIAGSTEVLKDLALFVSGSAAVLSAGTFAIAKVRGKDALAMTALSTGGRALSNVNLSLNAFSVVHGIAILLSSNAGTDEKAEAVVEIGSGSLGIAGRLFPVISAPAAAATASLLVNFHMFKGVFGHAMNGLAGLISLGLNICYRFMDEQAKWIGRQATSLAVAVDLSAVLDEPAKHAELTKQIEGIRWNLAMMLRNFLRDATTPGRNRNPGDYSVLRRRFVPLLSAKYETNVELITLASQVLEQIISCQKDAKQIYVRQVEESWARR